MRGKVSRIACWILLMALPVSAWAQTFDGAGRTEPANVANSSGLAGAMSRLPDFGSSLNFSGVNCLAGARVGYRHLGLNINFGIPLQQVIAPFAGQPFFFPQYGSLLDLYPLDITISGANLLVGGVDLAASVSNGVEIFGSIQANVPQRTTVEAGEGPGIGVLTPERWSWVGSRFQWVQFDLGAGRAVASNVVLIAGIKGERTTVRFADPEPVPGYTYLALFPAPPFVRPETATFPDFGGDLQSHLLMPYLGVRSRGAYANWMIRAGLASARLKLPLSLTHAGRYIGGVILSRGRSNLMEEAQYKFSHAGYFIETAVESKIGVTQDLNLNVWGEASWLRVRGDGQVDLQGQSSASLFGFAFSPVNFRASSGGPSHMDQYVLATGLSAVWAF